MKESRITVCIVNTKGTWKMLVLSKGEMRISKKEKKWKLKKGARIKVINRKVAPKLYKLITVIYQGQLPVHNISNFQKRKGRIIYKINMGRKYLNKRASGKLRKENRTKTKNTPTPRLHGDLFLLTIKTPWTTVKRTKLHQEQQDKGNTEEGHNSKSAGQELLSIQGSEIDPSLLNPHNNINMQEKQDAATTSNKIPGIDSVLPISQPPFTEPSANVVIADEAAGGLDGGCKEKPTNLQEGVTKGQNDKGIEGTGKGGQSQTQASGSKLKGAGNSQIQQVSRVNISQVSPINESPGNHTNNRSQSKPSKKKREAMKRKQQQEAESNGKNFQGKKVTRNQNQNQRSDYDVLNSEDEFDEDNQSLNAEEEDETSAHLIKAFGSTFQSKSQAEIQAIADQQCLSPRGRKQVRQQTRQASISTSANSSRTITRSKSKDNSQLNNYRIQLNMDNVFSNQNGKIWFFWTIDYDCTSLESDDQQVTCEMKHTGNPEKFMITFGYAKCKDELRRTLWDRFIHLSTVKIPWCTIGDFNVIISIDEKKGGIPYNMNKSFEFISVIEASGLIDLGYSGSQYTWCNNRAEEARVWKRLDRAMVNDH
ncbi:hypothetical protein KY289_015420 [Solanum tuberosum]|nr:hypothetical protein KY289_015420 [Solanum tuberosum]